MCDRKKCMRPGPITSNGYLNFLRDYRKQCCGMSPQETVRQGAKAWGKLSCAQKAKYRLMGCNVRPKPKCRRPRPRPHRRSCRPKRKRRSCRPKRKRRCAPKRRKPSCAKPRRRSCGRRKKCMKPGPVTNNGYLNFLRFYRRKHCGLKPNELVRRGARRWCSLPQEKKDRFRRMACKVSTSKRRRKSCLCRGVRRTPRRKRC